MSKIQNILTSFGAFWASLWIARLLGAAPDKLINMVIRDETVLSAFAMGVMSSMGRSFAAALAGILVTLVIAGRKSWLWALIVAVLYVVDAPVRHHWGYPAAAWDWLWQSVDLAFPAVACVAAALITARLRGKKGDAEPVVQPSVAG
jgi:hypothetical protein